MQIGTVLFFIVIGAGVAMAVFHLVKGAGPDSMWSLGRNDPIRNAVFRQDGSWRKYGKIGILAVLVVMVILAQFFH
jgi:hypothetical protein